MDMTRIESLEKFLHGTPNSLERSESTPLINILPDKEMKVSQ